jgi:hypothetical protein
MIIINIYDFINFSPVKKKKKRRERERERENIIIKKEIILNEKVS